jgi:hypothetical protein
MKNWMEETTGERIMAFPSEETLALDPDQDGWDHLKKHYDWSPQRPFEGLPEGDRCLEFRVLQRGWHANNKVLAPARVVPVEQDS